jgi:cleavage and polyadenylation specificity factor subunit 2
VELEEFQQKERAAKEKEAAHQAALARNQRMLEADEDESDSDTDSDSEEEDEVQKELQGGLDHSEMNGVVRDNLEVGRRAKLAKGVDGVDWGIDGDEGLTKQLLSFDIFLKGNVSKATSFFKSAGGQIQRFRMFPYVEKKRRVDEYGETIDVGMWLRKGKVLGEDATKDEAKDLQSRVEEDAKVWSQPYLPFFYTETPFVR